ncbi:hypothetical protein RB200_05140 [Streptomyces sp. PmtG]
MNQVWTPESATEILRGTARLAEAHSPSHFAVAGPILRTQIGHVRSTLANPQPPAALSGHSIDPDVLACVEARVGALEQSEKNRTSSTPMALYYAARTEHQLITDYLTRNEYDGRTVTRLLLLAARTAALCGWLSSSLGEEGVAERYSLVSIRAATAAGASDHTATYLGRLAASHCRDGNPLDALSLIRAARVIGERPSPRRAAVLYAREARAHALLGESAAGARALHRAEDALSAIVDDESRTVGAPDANIDEEWLTTAFGVAWLELGQPSRALDCFTSLLCDGPPSAVPASARPYTSRGLLHVVDAQLALSELDAAVRAARRAVALLGILPPRLAHAYRKRFASRVAEPSVRDLFELLGDPPRH